MLSEAQKFFSGERHTSIDYIQRQDYIGGNFYISLRKKGSRNILAIGEEESGNEFDLKCVETLEEVERVVDAIR